MTERSAADQCTCGAMKAIKPWAPMRVRFTNSNGGSLTRRGHNTHHVGFLIRLFAWEKGLEVCEDLPQAVKYLEDRGWKISLVSGDLPDTNLEERNYNND